MKTQLRLFPGIVLVALLCGSVEALAVKFVSPVSGGCMISARPGMRRHGMTGRGYNHAAYDFSTFPKGSKQTVRAAAAGTVEDTGFDSGCGHWVEIKHGQNLYTRYCHLQSASRVGKGKKVSAGTTLGSAGRTGRASGVHLHFETKTQPGWANNSRFDPVPKYISEAGFGCKGSKPGKANRSSRKSRSSEGKNQEAVQ